MNPIETVLRLYDERRIVAVDEEAAKALMELREASVKAEQRVGRLEEPPCGKGCSEKRGTYEMPGACSNCYTRYTLVIAKTHEVPSAFIGWRCPNCGCDRVHSLPRHDD